MFQALPRISLIPLVAGLETGRHMNTRQDLDAVHGVRALLDPERQSREWLQDQTAVPANSDLNCFRRSASSSCI